MPLGIDEDTLVLFTSDNGPWLSYGDHAGTTAGLREGKGTTFEGGVRVPCIARWPGTIPAGRVSGVHWMTIDVLPTIAALIDAPLPEQTIDGRDATLVLPARKEPRRLPNHLSFSYYHTGQLEAVRKDAGSSTCRTPTAPCRAASRGAAESPGVIAGMPRFKNLCSIWKPILMRSMTLRVPIPMWCELREVAEQWRTRLGDALTDRTGSEIRPAGQIDPPAN